jgi:hypothetical protein
MQVTHDFAGTCSMVQLPNTWSSLLGGFVWGYGFPFMHHAFCSSRPVHGFGAVEVRYTCLMILDLGLMLSYKS